MHVKTLFIVLLGITTVGCGKTAKDYSGNYAATITSAIKSTYVNNTTRETTSQEMTSSNTSDLALSAPDDSTLTLTLGGSSGAPLTFRQDSSNFALFLVERQSFVSGTSTFVFSPGSILFSETNRTELSLNVVATSTQMQSDSSGSYTIQTVVTISGNGTKK